MSDKLSHLTYQEWVAFTKEQLYMEKARLALTLSGMEKARCQNGIFYKKQYLELIFLDTCIDAFLYGPHPRQH